MAALGKRKILVVDDVPMSLALLAKALQGEYEVALFESALDALAMLEREQFDLILLDVVMPVMDGFAAFERIRALPLSAHTPIIFLTAGDDRTSERQGLALGAADFIFKPIRVDLVKLRIKNTIELARVAANLKASEERLRYVMEATGDGIWDWSIVANSVRHNRAWCDILGLDDECLEHPLEFFTDLIHREDFSRVRNVLQQCLDDHLGYRSEHRLRHSSGRYIWVEDRGTVVERDRDGKPLRMVGCIKNVDQRKRDEEEIQRQAFFDPLTELPNRRLFLDRLEQALLKVKRSGQFGALMFIDMDRFKELNDTHGHAMGDALLIQVGNRLKQIVREQDTVARLGGDEFVVILEELSKAYDVALSDATRVGEKILTRLNQDYELGAVNYKSTPSIGLTLFDRNAQTIDEVLARSDGAMYAAKQGGRNNLRIQALPMI